MNTSLHQLAAKAAAAAGRRCRVAVVCGTDEATIGAVSRAVSAGLAEAVFVGGNPTRDAFADAVRHGMVTFEATGADGPEASRLAVSAVREGRADILMKGLVSSDILLRAVLDKQHGLLPAGNVLTHVAAAEIPGRTAPLLFTDAAVIPYPTPVQRRAQIDALAALCRAMGREEPRIALIHCSEHVSDKFPHTADYRDIIAEAAAGRWGTVRIDGPLDVRCAVDAEALRIKGINSTLEGRADALVFPDIVSANAFYKTISVFAHAHSAGILCGTTHPVVLPSRGDDARTKYASLALAFLRVF